MNALDLMRPWLARHKRHLAGAVALAVLTVWAGVGLFTVAGWFLTGAFLAGASIAFDLFAPSALVRGLSFLRIGSRYAERVVGHAATLDILADLRAAIFARVMTLDPAQLARYREGDLVARLIGDVDTLDTLFLILVAPALTAIAAGLAFGVLAGVYAPLLAWSVTAVLLAGALLVPGVLARVSRRPGGDAQKAASFARAVVHDAVQGHADIAAFGAQSRAAAQFLDATRRLADARDRVAALGAWGQFAQQVMSGAGVLLLLWLGLLAFRAGAVTGPVWAGVVLGGMGLFEVTGPLMRGSSRTGAMAEGTRRVRALFRARPLIDDPAAPLDLPRTGALVLDDVEYRYGDGEPVFAHVDLRVEPGRRIAIKGPSGAGKSTLLSLLLRVVDPTCGQVSFGGIPLPCARLAQLHARVALLSQFSPVFLGTLRDNLRVGDSGATEARMWRALEQARLADFVRTLDDGLDTWVGESGETLSVGQARRLCLARTLLAPAGIWVLDEPTAGLDQATAMAFFRDLALAAGDRAIVMATHADLPDGVFDQVLQLENGALRPWPRADRTAGPIGKTGTRDV